MSLSLVSRRIDIVASMRPPFAKGGDRFPVKSINPTASGFNEAALREGRRFSYRAGITGGFKASMRPPFAKGGDSTDHNCLTVKEQTGSMRAVAHLAGEFPSLSTQLIVDLIGNKELPGRERPWGFSHRLAARNAHRVTNTEYSLSSPSRVFARSRAWISSSRL